MSESNTTFTDSGASTSSGSPNKKRPKKNSEADSPIRKSRDDLAKKIGGFHAQVLRATISSENPDLDKLNRFLITAHFTIETLKDICNLVEVVNKGDESASVGAAGVGTASVGAAGVGTSSVGVAGVGTAGVGMESQQNMILPSISPKKHTQTSPSAACITDLDLSVATFLGVARSEITLCIKADTSQPISPPKKRRLNSLLNCANHYLKAVETELEKIQTAIKKVDPKHQLKPNLILSDLESKVIYVMRNKKGAMKPAKQFLQAYGYIVPDEEPRIEDNSNDV